MQGVQRARDVGWLDWARQPESFDLTKYEHYEQVCVPDSCKNAYRQALPCHRFVIRCCCNRARVRSNCHLLFFADLAC